MPASNPLRVTTFAAVLALAACGGGDKPGGAAQTDTTLPAGTPAPTTLAPAGSGPVALGPRVAPSGRTIEIQMMTDDKGNRFDPDTVRAHAGDVLKFTMVTGVHNVDFLAARNPGVQGLPAPSELLQQPGQGKEYVVGLDPGSYYFQCDPHAALGMTGTLVVQ
jgi:plastocyanin